MKQISLLFGLLLLVNASFSQIRLAETTLCDDGRSYLNKTVTFRAMYFASHQSDNWNLRAQDRDYERINSAVNFNQTQDNDKFYTRKIVTEGCNYFLRIPYGLPVPNVGMDFISITGKITYVTRNADIMLIEVKQITR